MSPLALYIEQIMYRRPDFSPSPHPTISVYPPSPPKNQIFDSLHAAPTLDKDLTNRIILYFGSFNPPHRGHLHLLKHAFTRGTHNLNVKAAFILPRSDNGVSAKVRAEDGKLLFGIDERCLLWEQDLCFPPWAWVYNNKDRSLETFLERLIQATKKDGYSLEYIPLYGAGIASPEGPPDPVYGCKTLIMSDASRKADFQLSSGRLENFLCCTKWTGFSADEDELRLHARAIASRALLDMKTICPHEADEMLKDGNAYVERTTEAYAARTIEDVKGLVTCDRPMWNGTLTLRFVKCQGITPRAEYNDISSTTLREIMHTKTGVKLKEGLDWMALSADLLWRYRYVWIDKATSGTGRRITFPQSILELGLPDEYPDPPHFDDPPSFEEIGFSEVHETSRAIEELPAVEEHPTIEPAKVQEVSPENKQSSSPQPAMLQEASPASEKHTSIEPPTAQEVCPGTEQLTLPEEFPAINQQPSIKPLPPPQGLSPPITQLPSLDPPTSQEPSPPISSPSPPKSPPPNTKKRAFSATGLEDDIMIIGDAAGARLLAEGIQIKKPLSCRF